MELVTALSSWMTWNVQGMKLTCLSVGKKLVLMTAHMMKMLQWFVWVSYHLCFCIASSEIVRNYSHLC